MKIISLLLTLSLLTSCASKSKDTKKSKLTKFTIEQNLIKGKTTKAEVIEILGSPEMVNSSSDKTEQWVYSKSRSERKGGSVGVGLGFLSLLSASALGGAYGDVSGHNESTSTKMSTLSIYFSKKGIVDRYSFSKTRF